MHRQSDKAAPVVQQKKQKRVLSVWQIVNSHANDNTPSFRFWLAHILWVSLVFLGIIYCVSSLIGS